MFALIRQVQQLACPGYPADSDWDGEISVSVSRPFRVRACSKVGLAQLPVYLTRPVASVFSRSAPGRSHSLRACAAAEQYNLESYFPVGKRGSTTMDPNEKNYIDATLGNFPNKW